MKIVQADCVQNLLERMCCHQLLVLSLHEISTPSKLFFLPCTGLSRISGNLIYNKLCDPSVQNESHVEKKKYGGNGTIGQLRAGELTGHREH